MFESLHTLERIMYSMAVLFLCGGEHYEHLLLSLKNNYYISIVLLTSIGPLKILTNLMGQKYPNIDLNNTFDLV